MDTHQILTAEKFLSIIRQENMGETDGKKFYKNYLGKKFIVFENVQVEGNITIPKEFKTDRNIIFRNCKFQYFRIDGGAFQDFRIGGGAFQYFKINGGAFQDFRIDGGELQYFRIYGGEFQDFRIYGGEFQDFRIYGGAFQDFRIYGGALQYFIISGGEFQYFRIYGGELQYFKIYGGALQYFKISGGAFQDFRIYDGAFQDFRIYGGAFQDFRIYGGALQYFKISGGKFFVFTAENIETSFEALNPETQKNEKKSAKGAAMMNFLLTNGNIRQANLKFGFLDTLELCPFNDGVITVEETDINELTLAGSGNGSIYLRALALDKLNFDGLDNNGHIFLADIKANLGKDRQPQRYSFKPITYGKKFPVTIQAPKKAPSATLNFKKADLGKTKFTNVNFENFKTINLSGSNFSNITQYEHYFPQTTGACALAKNTHQVLYETYRDLSLAADKQKHVNLRFGYHALSQDEYYNTLNWKENFTEAVLIGFNKCSNAHGTNWWKPLLWLLVSNLFFLLPYLGLNGFWFQPFSFENIGNFLGIYAEFINPTHKIDFLKPYMGSDTVNAFSKVFDLLNRVFGGVFIYQTVIAFRKFSRK